MSESSDPTFRVIDLCHGVNNPELSAWPRDPSRELPSMDALIEQHVARMDQGGVEKASISAG